MRLIIADKSNVRLRPVNRIVMLLGCCSAISFLACCGGSSNPSLNGSSPAAPAIASLNPPSVEAGGPSFEITIDGSNFDPSCIIQWQSIINASQTTYQNVFVSSTELEAQISASDVADIGPVGISLICKGGSTYAQFLATGFPRIEIDEAANDLVWDPVHDVIYLSVPPTVSGGSGIAVLDPSTAKITSFTPLTGNPDVLAISDDGQYLYVGLDDSSSVQRYTLPQLTPDIEFSIGEQGEFPFDIQVAPGAPHTTAVSIGIPGITTPAEAGVTIFDDAVPRPKSVAGIIEGGSVTCYCGSLQWGSASNALYSNNSMTSGFDFYNMSVDSSGVTMQADTPGVFGSFNGIFWNNIHYMESTGFVYSDDRHVVAPSTASVVGTFDLSPGAIDSGNRMVADSGLNAAIFLYSADNCVYDGGVCLFLTAYNPTNFSYTNSLEVSEIKMEYGPINLIRWGASGVAFNTDTGQVYLVDISSLLQPAPAASPRRLPQYLPLRSRQKVLTTTMRRLLRTVPN